MRFLSRLCSFLMLVFVVWLSTALAIASEGLRADRAQATRKIQEEFANYADGFDKSQAL